MCGLRQDILVVMIVSLLVAPRAFAQTEEGGPDPSRIRVRLGPLWINPTISLNNLGVDTNVFNVAVDPKSDFTFTVSPRSDLWLRIGRTWVSGVISEDVVWYQTYASERSANSLYQINWLVPLTRLSFRVGAEHLSTRERAGFEIDARARRDETAYNGSVDLRFLSRTSIGFSGAQRMINFDEAAVFLDVNLHDELTRRRTSGAVNLSHRLTPLTTLTFTVAREWERFSFGSLRDSNSTKILGSVQLDQFALIKGGASFGYRDFKPLSSSLPGYKGSTAEVDLSYSALGTSRFSVRAIRDVQYSYDVDQPYYVETGVSAEIAQQIFGPVDVVGRAGVSRLEYRDRMGAVIAASDRTDRVRTYGGGIGYHMGREIRIGFNIDSSRRVSAVDRRQYKGLRYGTAVTYGL